MGKIELTKLELCHISTALWIAQQDEKWEKCSMIKKQTCKDIDKKIFKMIKNNYSGDIPV